MQNNLLIQIGLGIKEIKQDLNGAKLAEFLTNKLTELENLQTKNTLTQKDKVFLFNFKFLQFSLF